MCSCSGMARALACIHLSVRSLVLAVTLSPTYLESHAHQVFSAGPRAGVKLCVDEAGPASESPVLRLSTHLTFRASVLLLLLLWLALLILELSVLVKAHSFSVASVSWSPMSHQAHRSFPAPHLVSIHSASFSVSITARELYSHGTGLLHLGPGKLGLVGKLATLSVPWKVGFGDQGWLSELSWDVRLGGMSSIPHHPQHKLVHASSMCGLSERRREGFPE